MTFRRFTPFALAAATLTLCACAGAPATDGPGIVDRSLAAAHSEIAFMLSHGTRPETSCAGVPCQNWVGNSGAGPTPFETQVQRLAAQLQGGANSVYPDLNDRIPGFATHGFDVYVAPGKTPGSSSSAGGKIALNTALGALQPYDDWLAFVIAREMGHVIARHHEENSAASMATSIMMNLLLPGSSLLKSAASTVGSGIASGSKREQQAEEADLIAFVLLEAAGFRLRDVSLSLLVAASTLDEGSWSADFRKSADTLVSGIRAGKRLLVSRPKTFDSPATKATLLSARTATAPLH